MKKVIIGDATLYHGNCLELEDIKADMILSDPPYKLTAGGGTPKKGVRMSGKFNHKEYNNDGNIVTCDIDWTDFMPRFYEWLADRGHAYVMCNNRHIQNMLNSAEKAGFDFHNMLVWDKVNATPNRWYMKNLEFIGFFYKGKAFYINDCGSKQSIVCPQDPQTDHPTEKPAQLMEYYIRMSTQPAQTVFDPFMGSGSTGVGAIRAGRKFTGCELEEKWFDIACEQIEQAQKQWSLV